MATETEYKSKEEVLLAAACILHKTLRDIIDADDLLMVERKLKEYETKRKGFLGNLVEKYVFGLENNNRAEADFSLAGIELKTTPLRKHDKKSFVSKERLVFSMIDYNTIVEEKWETSSFLKKNRLLLIMFYIWLKNQSLLDYKFEFVQFLDLLDDISTEDILQIRKDWEFIVAKIHRGEAHLLSEGDTFYLGACTKAANSRVVRDQPRVKIPAKPRAFSLKQTYLNYLIQKKILGQTPEAPSLYSGISHATKTVEDIVREKFSKFIGKTDKYIVGELGYKLGANPKNYKRLIVNQILTGTGSNHVEELDKADITLKVLTLEHTGTLKESISFPAFVYKDLIAQVWYDEKEEVMSDFHAQLEIKKFLFVIFKKQKDSDDIVLYKTMFWNFPAKDMDKARDVWEKTVEQVEGGKIVKEVVAQKGIEKTLTHFPGISFNGVAHVRPHGANKKDTSPLPIADQLTGRKEHTKQCFWLNASYIQQAIENEKDQD